MEARCGTVTVAAGGSWTAGTGVTLVDTGRSCARTGPVVGPVIGPVIGPATDLSAASAAGTATRAVAAMDAEASTRRRACGM
ncbi:hypothetical protein GCM10022224_013360 [Nonomuraea antimicrobica]|uniref:Uncharacterized protein n=1 Tax=Nonomuraea antimicrobica TaxID=561173 RepID=A0ABP7B900_9ACTN